MVAHMLFYVASVLASMSQVSAHAALWARSMFGLNQSSVDNPKGNRPQDPLIELPFDEWWFHGHLDFPPHPEDVMQLPAGGQAEVEISCDIDATSLWPFGPGGNQTDPADPDNPCPRSPMASYHTNGINDLGGCGLAVAYKSNARDVQPEDFVIFSVNHTCVWSLHTHFSIPEDMPKCDDGKCTCAFFWLHLQDSGSEQMYMNGFQCNFTNTSSNKKLGTPKVARRCGAEEANNFTATPSNCTHGPKQPFYWLQKEGNNTFEGYYSPPQYNLLYNFVDGAQNDIFEEDSTNAGSSSISPSSSTQGSNSANLVANPTQASSSSASHGTPTSSTGTPDPAAQSSSYASTMSGGTSYTNSWAAKSTAGGPDQSGKCSKHPQKTPHPGEQSQEYRRDDASTDEQAMRRAWGAHRRRSVGNHESF